MNEREEEQVLTENLLLKNYRHMSVFVARDSRREQNVVVLSYISTQLCIVQFHAQGILTIASSFLVFQHRMLCHQIHCIKVLKELSVYVKHSSSRFN